jgi:hypothetical protein
VGSGERRAYNKIPPRLSKNLNKKSERFFKMFRMISMANADATLRSCFGNAGGYVEMRAKSM